MFWKVSKTRESQLFLKLFHILKVIEQNIDKKYLFKGEPQRETNYWRKQFTTHVNLKLK